MIDTIWCKILSSIYNSLPYLQWVTWAFNGTLTLVSCGSDFRCSWLGSSWLRMAQLKHGGNQHTDIQKLPEPWSKKWSCMTHDMAASNSASKSIQINSNELPWLSFTIPLTKTWTLASFWSSDPLGCPWVWASWQKKNRELTTVLNTLMSFALRAPCPGANDKDYIVGVNMCQPSKIHPGVLL